MTSRESRAGMQTGPRLGGGLVPPSEIQQARIRVRAEHSQGWPERRTFAMAAGVFGLFVLYGSLLPFHFQPVPWITALGRFREIAYLSLGIDSRADLVANMLLFAPLGYLTIAAIATDREGPWARMSAALGTAFGVVALAIALEFGQLFFPSRTVSLNDIGAECLGGVTGIAAWLYWGPAATKWLRDFSGDREPRRALRRILLVCCLLIVVGQTLPLDVTINLGQLAEKYRAGRIVLRPFGHEYSSLLLRVWDYGGDVAINAPFGAAACLLWLKDGGRRPFLSACAIGSLCVAAIEAAQLFIYSRYADVTDLLTGTAGVMVGAGWAILGRDSGVARVAHQARLVNEVALAGCFIWIAALSLYYWYPFDFSFASEHVVPKAHALLSLPFSNYYRGTEFHAFTEASRKFLLALPLGVLANLAWLRPAYPGTARLRSILLTCTAVAVLFCIEAGQVLLPSRVPDLTDVLLGLGGFMTGSWLIHVLAPAQLFSIVGARYRP